MKNNLFIDHMFIIFVSVICSFNAMSPRFKSWRKIVEPPTIKGLKPYGGLSDLKKEPVMLLFEEYESLKRCDYEMMNHHQAAVTMQVSRPTFTRIYASARIKIATALAEGRQLVIEGGKVYFDSDWYGCNSCSCYFSHSDKTTRPDECPLCGSGDIREAQEDTLRDTQRINKDVCICTSCHHEETHTQGIPCQQTICPRCGKAMRRKPKKKSV